MRLDDINAFIDAKRVYERAYRRVFREDRDATVYVPSVSAIKEIATLTDTSIRRTPLLEGGCYWTVSYRGVTFQHFSTADPDEVERGIESDGWELK